MVQKTRGKNRPTTRILTQDDGMPSDFIQIRISNAGRHKGKILKYRHLLLGWLSPTEAYLIKLIAEHGKDVINWGYQLNFKIMDILTPQGSLAGEIVTIAADIALFASLKDYADKKSRENKTDPKFEYAKLLAIMALPYGMVILVGMSVFNISAKDWGKIINIFPGPETELGKAVAGSPFNINTIIGWFSDLFSGGVPPQYPDVEEH